MATKNPYSVGSEEAIKWEQQMGQGTAAGVAASTPGLTAEQIAAEQVKNEPINPDVAAGNLLMQQRQASLTPRTDASGATVGYGPEPAGAGITGSSSSVKGFESGVKTAVSDITVPDASTDGVRQASANYMSEIDRQIADLENQRKDRVANIEKSFAVAKDLSTRAQQSEIGTTTAALFRVGGFLGVQMSGVAVLNNMASTHRLEMNDLEAKRASAISAANNAIDDKQYALALKKAEEAKALEQTIYDRSRNAFEDMVKLNKEMREADKYAKESATATLSAIAESGAEYSDTFFEVFDQSNGFTAGFSKGLFNLAKKASTQDAVKNAMELNKLLSDVPMGTPVSVGGFTYYGQQGAGTLQINDTTGDASIFQVDQATGKITQKKVGNVGAAKDGWVQVYQNGEFFRFNQRTGEFKSVDGAKADLSVIVPPGVYQGIPGQPDAFPDLPLQCGEFVNWMTGSTVGMNFKDKMALVDPSIKAENAIVGNTIVFQSGDTGHVAIINDIYTEPGPNGRLKFVLSEANKKSPGEVTHDREVYADDPAIKGYQDTSFKPEFSVGTDSTTAAALARVRAAEQDGSTSVYNRGNDDIAQAASNLAAGQKNADARASAGAQINTAWERSKKTNDPKYIREELYMKAMNAAPAADKTSYTGRLATKNGLTKAVTLLDELTASGKNTNLFTGTYEDIYKKLGATNDPKMRELASFIRPMMMDYRKAQTGVAFSERESAQYEELFPNIKQDATLFKANVKGLLASMENADQSFIESYVGPTAYQNIFVGNPLAGGASMSVSSQASPKVIIDKDGKEWDASAYSPEEIQEALKSGYTTR